MLLFILAGGEGLASDCPLGSDPDSVVAASEAV